MATFDLASLGPSTGLTVFGADGGLTSHVGPFFGDVSGYSVSGVGDVDADGYSDFLIGAPFTDSINESRATAGESYLLYGGPSMPATIDLALASSQRIVVLYGAEPRDQSGDSLSGVGDVNGDGFDDFVVGAWLGGTGQNSEAESGNSYLIYGGANLPKTIDLKSIGTRGVLILGADADDRSGHAVRGAGDVNGDGLDDILIGSYRGDGFANQRSNAGEVSLILGSRSLPGTIDLERLGGIGVYLLGTDAEDNAGWSVSGAGDMNGDGFDDIAIGAYNADGKLNQTSNAGEAYIVFGRATFPPTILLDNLGSSGVRIHGSEVSGKLGFAVSSAGDFNGDGYFDLAVSAKHATDAQISRLLGGATHILFGSPALPETIDLTPGLSADAVKVTTIFGASVSDESGASLASGDFDGDGFDDLIIGAPGSDTSFGNRSDAGTSYVIFGGGTYQPKIDLANLGDQGLAIFGVDADDLSGASVGFLGDVNGDGFGDLIIGAQQADSVSNSRPTAGESYVVYGSNVLGRVNVVGTSASETLVGTSGRDAVVAGMGNDIINANGGPDSVYAGLGDDTVLLINGAYQRADGGRGSFFDSLWVAGRDIHLNLTSPNSNRIRNFERIDISGQGTHRVTLNTQSILRMSANNNTLLIEGDTQDRVFLVDTWTVGNIETIFSNRYRVYSSGIAKVKIDERIVVGHGFIANSDSYSVPVNRVLETTDADGLQTTSTRDNGLKANDIGTGINQANAILRSAPTLGVVEIASNGTFRYTPSAQAQSGQSDTFTYYLRNDLGLESENKLVTVRLEAPFVPRFQNTRSQYDVNDDGVVTPTDILVIINFLNRNGTVVDVQNSQINPPPFVDVSGDGLASPTDILQVINQLARRSGPEGETGNDQADWDASGRKRRRLLHDEALTSADLFTTSAI